MPSRLPVANAFALCAFAVVFGIVGLALGSGAAQRQLAAGLAPEGPARSVPVAELFAPPNYVLEACI